MQGACTIQLPTQDHLGEIENNNKKQHQNNYIVTATDRTSMPALLSCPVSANNCILEHGVHCNCLSTFAQGDKEPFGGWQKPDKRSCASVASCMLKVSFSLPQAPQVKHVRFSFLALSYRPLAASHAKNFMKVLPATANKDITRLAGIVHGVVVQTATCEPS